MGVSERLLSLLQADAPDEVGKPATTPSPDIIKALAGAAQSYLKWNMMGSPGATPGELMKGMADWASLPMREPVHVPADSHTDDSGRILVKRDGQLVPWQEADPVASRAYEEDMRARSQWGPQAALSMMGGTPFAARGAVGATGARPLQMAAEPIADATQPGIRAYHGSPHDFNQFDLSKVGTGEGAQAYGHGLNLAENEATAKTYRDALSGHPFDTRSSGHMYEVNINAKPEHFFDWDKYPEQQSSMVQEALKKLDLFDEQKIARAADNPAVTAKLLDSGVAGFKYLDRGSRSSGAGTSNYVVFDPRIIEILKKYGLAGAVGGPAAAGAGLETQTPQQ